MGLGGVIGNIGSLEYDIVSNDKTGPATQSAIQNVKDMKVSYSDLATNTAFAFNQISIAINTVTGYGRQVKSIVDDAGRLGKSIKDNARDLGMSADEYQRWTHAAVAAGSSGEEITGVIRRFSVQMNSASNATSEMGKKFKAYGIDVRDAAGNARPMNDVLIDTLEVINKLPEGAERNGASMALFGRSFVNIADLASMSREQIMKFKAEAHIISDDDLQMMDDYNTSMALMDEEMKYLWADVGNDLMPTMQDLAQLFKEMMPFIKDVGVPAVEALARSLEMASRGFHMMGAEANIAWTYATKGTEAGYKEQVKLGEWMSAKLRDDAMKAAGYDTDGMGNVVIKPTITTTQKGSSPSMEVDEEAMAKAEADRVKTIVDAYKDYEDAIKAVTKAKQDDANDTRSYLENVQAAGNDMGRIRQLTMARNQALRTKATQIDDLEGVAMEKGEMAQQSYAMYRAQPMVESANKMLGAAGMSPITIGTVNLTEKYDFPKLMKDIEAWQRNQGKQAGIRTAT